jgi:hypothetical protein
MVGELPPKPRALNPDPSPKLDYPNSRFRFCSELSSLTEPPEGATWLIPGHRPDARLGSPCVLRSWRGTLLGQTAPGARADG